MSCGIGHRRGSYLALLWLWRRLAAIALIRPLAWELPYAASAALKKQKLWSSRCGAAETNLPRNHEVVGSIPGLTQWDLALPKDVV